MSPWLAGLLCAAAVSCWAAFGCSALREFSYSRLEALCDRYRRPLRFRSILTDQDQTLLAVELLRTVGVLMTGTLLAGWLGAPVEWQPGPVSLWLLEYFVNGTGLALFIHSVPWLITRVASEPFLLWNWPLMQLVCWIQTPFIRLLRSADRVAHRVSGLEEPEADDAAVIEEEIRTVVDEGRREGVLEQHAGAMIERVMQLQEEDVGAIMTPRIDMCCIHVEASLEEARQQLLASGHSRVPIIGESTDDIIGVLYAKDLLGALNPHRQPGEPIAVLRDLVREPIYVPVTSEIPGLLELMKREHIHLAIVLDEYGGVAGLVTLEDILEEIVGEIGDEYDDRVIPDEDVRVLSEQSIEVDARVHLDDLNKRFEYSLPEDSEFDTIGGFVFSLLGRIPKTGEATTWNGLTFTVLEVKQRALQRLRIDRQVAGTSAAG
jgi:putative hemolysin